MLGKTGTRTIGGELTQGRGPDVVAKEIGKSLRRDIENSGVFYRSAIKDLQGIVRGIASEHGDRSDQGDSFDSQSDSILSESSSGDAALNLATSLNSYKGTLQRLEQLRAADEGRMIQFAQALQQTPGQNMIFTIYQKEYRPEMAPALRTRLNSDFQDRPEVLGLIAELFDFYRRDLRVNMAKVRQAYLLSGAIFHFVLLTPKTKTGAGTVMREQSEDMFKIYSEIADVTGGQVASTANAAQAVRDIEKNLSSYYLLFFLPDLAPAEEQRLNRIEIRLKDTAAAGAVPQRLPFPLALRVHEEVEDQELSLALPAAAPAESARAGSHPGDRSRRCGPDLPVLELFL